MARRLRRRYWMSPNRPTGSSVCNSFSKTWVMTGWRLGWLVVPEGTRDAITEFVEVTHSGVAPFIQHAGLAAVQRRRGGGAVSCPLRRRPRTDG